MFVLTEKERLDNVTAYVRGRIHELNASCEKLEGLIGDERFKELPEEARTALEIEAKVCKVELFALINVNQKL